MKTRISILLCAILAIACSKDDNEGNSGGGASGALLKSSSGWKKTGTIEYSASTTGFEGSQAMTPYDLASVGNELALLYSEDYKLTSYQGNKVFKVKFAPDAGNISGSIPLQRGGYSFCTSTRFIPGSFNPVYVKISNDNPSMSYTCMIATEDGGFIAGNNLGAKPIAPINWYPDGGLTMSLKWSAANGNISDALSYTFPNPGNFTVTENQWSLDPTRWIQTSALRLSGGEINQFILSRENDKVFFSIIKDDPSYVATNGVQHNFFMLARKEIPGLVGSNFDPNCIIASTVVNDKYTVLIGESGNGSHSFPVIKKVHCYQWQKGSAEFTKLYGDIAVPEDVGANLMLRNSIGEYPVIGFGAPVKFTPDGTAYMLYNYSSSNYVQNDEYTALVTLSQSGAKIMGKYAAADYPDGFYDQVGLGVCQYHNGAYYAVVFQRNEVIYSKNDPKFRMEIVKLVP